MIIHRKENIIRFTVIKILMENMLLLIFKHLTMQTIQNLYE